jgi:beta-galactosidase GanA
VAVIAIILGCCLCRSTAQPPSSLPHLQKHGTSTQLIVGGKPFPMLAGELANSSASDAAYMSPVWPKLTTIGLNTVLMPVYWELVEPAEGHFDFSLVDELLASARKNDLKVVILWFGTWKNSMSCYAPAWIKTDQKRFPRARTHDGKALEILTPFSDENRNADARAFARLMQHLREIDGVQNTVVMVQVENEIGMIPEARDFCTEAQQAFDGQVPAELIAVLKKSPNSTADIMHTAWQKAGMRGKGTWVELFGQSLATDEFFMAWHFARYTEYVVQSGKQEYPLPMYVNGDEDHQGRHMYLPGSEFGVQKVRLYT